jgi:hypothetical protein
MLKRTIGVSNPERGNRPLNRLQKKLFKWIPAKLRWALLRKKLKLNRLNQEEMSFSLATTAEELTAAYALLHDCYVQEGYMKPHASGIRCTIFHALPHSTVLICKYKGQVVSTVTLFKDSPLGLPSDKEYRNENDSYRKQGYQLCEVSSLATHPKFRGGDVTFHMIKYLWNYSTDCLGVTLLCCVVNPKAEDFYKAFLNFKRNGPEISYDFVEGAKGIHLTRDLICHQSWMKNQYQNFPFPANLYNFFYRETSPFFYPKRSFGLLVDPVFTPDMLSEFFVKKTDVFKSAEPYELALVRSAYALYSEIDVEEWGCSSITNAVHEDREFRYPTSMKASLECENLHAMGTVTDLSPGGFFFRTSAVLDIGQVHTVTFNLENQRFHFPVELRWQSVGPLHSGYGVRFLAPPESLIQELKQVCERLSRKATEYRGEHYAVGK